MRHFPNTDCVTSNAEYKRHRLVSMRSIHVFISTLACVVRTNLQVDLCNMGTAATIWQQELQSLGVCHHAPSLQDG
eukprot:scaffold96921_cov32-Prasinocladus_malaysianus.AAC.2